jgi:2-polyprenyl-3-methyl-5-hydroxy-6-metoxy-1,4-benzoquinol methylase
MKQIETDEIYKNVSLKEIPWNIETPPDVIVQLVACGKIKPCNAIDLGCGTGNYAIYLAGKGFNVTGVDTSPVAIKFAMENAMQKKVDCNFIVADVLDDLKNHVKGPFDFAYDWEVLHHVYPRNRKKFVENVFGVLNPGGKYLSVCFSEKDQQFGASGKYRKTRLGTILYFSSEKELFRLYSLYFDVIELKTIEITGKSVSHFVNYAFMEKRPE